MLEDLGVELAGVLLLGRKLSRGDGELGSQIRRRNGIATGQGRPAITRTIGRHSELGADEIDSPRRRTAGLGELDSDEADEAPGPPVSRVVDREGIVHVKRVSGARIPARDRLHARVYDGNVREIELQRGGDSD